MAKYRREGIGFLGRIERWIAARNEEYRAAGHQALGINLDDMSEAEELPPEVYGYH